MRRIDSRFLLPRAPGSAVVLGDLPGWREGLSGAGIERHESSDERKPDLAVAAASSLSAALASRAEMIVAEGRRLRPDPRSSGYSVQRYLPLPDVQAPQIMLPIDQRAPCVYAIENWTVSSSHWKAVRNRLLAMLAGHGFFPAFRSTVHVAVREASAPFIVAAARRELSLPPVSGWFLILGEGDAGRPGVFLVFADGDAMPSWVFKFSRTPGGAPSLEAGRDGLELAARAGGSIADHAPKLLGSLHVNGLRVVAETAAPGRQLGRLLLPPGRRSGKLRLIESVAEWLVEMARISAGPHELLEPELHRFGESVLPLWRSEGASRSLTEGLTGVPAVLEHRDLGPWNVILGSHGFTVVDWETACAHGFPVWDLVYFLTGALAQLDGAFSPERRPEHARKLFRGELASSAVLFQWIRQMAATLSLAPVTVGCLATSCWLHQGAFHPHRDHWIEEIARAWLSDPLLGMHWDRWLQ